MATNYQRRTAIMVLKMSNTRPRVRLSSRTARVLLALLFSFPVVSSLVMVRVPSYAKFGNDVGFTATLPLYFLFAFPIAGILIAVIVFGSIFLWEWHRKSLSVAWFACGVWCTFAQVVAAYSAPLWYRTDDWGYTFVGERSSPVAVIVGVLFFLIGFRLARIAFETDDSLTTEQEGRNKRDDSLGSAPGSH